MNKEDGSVSALVCGCNQLAGRCEGTDPGRDGAAQGSSLFRSSSGLTWYSDTRRRQQYGQVSCSLKSLVVGRPCRVL